LNKLRQHPILILLVINLIIGLMTFRSYGLAWDEPLFYDYGEALKYAYTPGQLVQRRFQRGKLIRLQRQRSRQPRSCLSAACRANRLAFKMAWIDLASAWHLTNFLTFNLGIYLLYRLASKWMRQRSALRLPRLFAFQPLLWGHAFINPKDIPFLVFFLGSSSSGSRWLTKWTMDNGRNDGKTRFASSMQNCFSPPSSSASPPPSACWDRWQRSSPFFMRFSQK
jgi:hypothetical protein